jgi:hypothetical protein
MMERFSNWLASTRLCAARPAVYACIVLAVACAAWGHQVRTRTIFSCSADGYSADRYLAYCQGENYADYEHGAFQFGLEPAVPSHVQDADVLFLGNSRLQFAFSTKATADWFSAASARYYLMGFTYWEDVIFAEELLRTIRPRARVLVINVDDFFDRSESAPVKAIFHDPEARHKYEAKQIWQRIHQRICGTFAHVCGSKYAIFRSRETGSYYREGDYSEGGAHKSAPISYDQIVDPNTAESNIAVARDFLSRFAQGKCVILTNIPFVETKIGTANAIAKGLGTKLVAPEVTEGLWTFDGSHLDQPSAERWSEAFFLSAGAKIRSCLEEGPVHSSAYRSISR